MKIALIIPARLKSERLPGKVLKKILKIPMLIHCYYRSCKSLDKENVFIASCDKQIENLCKKKKINYLSTPIKHKRALTRTSEAAKKIKNLKDNDLAIMYQGDEPFIDPVNIKKIIQFFKKNNTAKIANLLFETRDQNFAIDKNNVKAIIDEKKNIIYYSRYPIPYYLKGKKNKYFIQTGLIAMKKKYLNFFNSKKSTQHESAESIDMNRLIDKSIDIKSVLTKSFSFGIDTKKDLILANKMMKKDKIYLTYKAYD